MCSLKVGGVIAINGATVTTIASSSQCPGARSASIDSSRGIVYAACASNSHSFLIHQHMNIRACVYSCMNTYLRFAWACVYIHTSHIYIDTYRYVIVLDMYIQVHHASMNICDVCILCMYVMYVCMYVCMYVMYVMYVIYVCM